MIRQEIKQQYFDWMYQLITENQTVWKESYHTLFKFLHNVEFIAKIPMDENRAADGINLRYRFGNECSCKQAIIANVLDEFPCSVLEMMVSLTLRCEEDIVGDYEKGNRTGVWFMNMLISLGLDDMYDENFDLSKARYIITAFLDRNFCRNGKGGLFTIKGNRDMRTVEIWYQMHCYLNEIEKGE